MSSILINESYRGYTSLGAIDYYYFDSLEFQYLPYRDIRYYCILNPVTYKENIIKTNNDIFKNLNYDDDYGKVIKDFIELLVAKFTIYLSIATSNYGPDMDSSDDEYISIEPKLVDSIEKIKKFVPSYCFIEFLDDILYILKLKKTIIIDKFWVHHDRDLEYENESTIPKITDDTRYITLGYTEENKTKKYNNKDKTLKQITESAENLIDEFFVELTFLHKFNKLVLLSDYTKYEKFKENLSRVLANIVYTANNQ